jgi:hypothetical protein
MKDYSPSFWQFDADDGKQVLMSLRLVDRD